MLLACCCYAVGGLLLCSCYCWVCYAAVMLLLGCCFGVVLPALCRLLSLCCCRCVQYYSFIGFILLLVLVCFIVLCPFVSNFSIAARHFLTIQRELLDQSIFLCVADTENWFYNILRLYMFLHMPSTLCFICSLMVFYIFCGVSSFFLVFRNRCFSNLNFLKMHRGKL